MDEQGENCITLACVNYTVLNTSHLFGTIKSPPAAWNQIDATALRQHEHVFTNRKVRCVGESLQGNVTKWQQVECAFPSERLALHQRIFGPFSLISL